MAAVTINRQRSAVFGSKRVRLLNINIAATGDTLTQVAMRSVDVAFADGGSTTAVNTSFTVGTAGPIAFNYTGGGAANNVDVMLIGN